MCSKILYIVLILFAFNVYSQQDIPGQRKGAPSLTKGFTVNEDLFIRGSLGVGNDMDADFSFTYSTTSYEFAMAENNLRILFDDASSAGNYPDNDWMFEFNDQQYGGLGNFKIKDVSNSTTPFYIGANAPDNSLFVQNISKDGSAQIGLGLALSTPVSFPLNIYSSSNPSIRMQQTGGVSNDYSWEFGLNQNVFEIRDVDAGTTPLKIANDGSRFTVEDNQIVFSRDTEIKGCLYIGDSDTDGSWRISNINGVLTFEIRDNGSWEVAMELD